MPRQTKHKSIASLHVLTLFWVFDTPLGRKRKYLRGGVLFWKKTWKRVASFNNILFLLTKYKTKIYKDLYNSIAVSF
jgi:hypothetical protein